MRGRRTIVGLGELLWDCFGGTRRPGGAPANVAWHATLLGHRGVIVSRVGRDALGDELIEHLAGRGLCVDYVQRDGGAPTGTVDVDASEVGRLQFTIREDVAWDGLEPEPRLDELLGGCDAVCFGTLAQRRPASRATIRRGLERAERALRVFDVNLRRSYHSPDVIADSVAHADVLKLSDEEVAVVADALGLPADEPSLARACIEHHDLEAVAVTRGGRGCLLVSRGDEVEVPGVRGVEVVDAVGAGDAFTAALTAARLWGWPATAAARLANGAGAIVAGRAGAMPDVGDDYARLRRGIEREFGLEPARP